MPVDEFEEILEEALLGDLALREGHCETETSEVAEQLESAASQLMQVPCAWSWKIIKPTPFAKGGPSDDAEAPAVGLAYECFLRQRGHACSCEAKPKPPFACLFGCLAVWVGLCLR